MLEVKIVSASRHCRFLKIYTVGLLLLLLLIVYSITVSKNGVRTKWLKMRLFRPLFVALFDIGSK